MRRKASQSISPAPSPRPCRSASACDQHATSTLPATSFIHVSVPLLSRWRAVSWCASTSCSLGSKVLPSLLLATASQLAPTSHGGRVTWPASGGHAMETCSSLGSWPSCVHGRLACGSLSHSISVKPAADLGQRRSSILSASASLVLVAPRASSSMRACKRRQASSPSSPQPLTSLSRSPTVQRPAAAAPRSTKAVSSASLPSTSSASRARPSAIGAATPSNHAWSARTNSRSCASPESAT